MPTRGFLRCLFLISSSIYRTSNDDRWNKESVEIPNICPTWFQFKRVVLGDRTNTKDIIKKFKLNDLIFGKNSLRLSVLKRPKAASRTGEFRVEVDFIKFKTDEKLKNLR